MRQRDNSNGSIATGTTRDVHAIPQSGDGGQPHYAARRRGDRRDSLDSNRPPVNTAYYPLFDWLRGILALVVMFSHLGILPGEQTGALAVQIFFALSGWLIGGLLLHMQREDVARFYFHRALRIWIPYYLGLLLLVSVSLVRDRVTLKWCEMVFYKLTFVYNLFGPEQLAAYRSQMPLQATGHHFWSVNAEEQFYLVAPLLLVFLPARLGRHVITWTSLAIATWWLHTYFVSIVFGVLAAVVVDQLDMAPKRILSQTIFALVALFSLGGVIIGYDLLYLAPIGATSLVMLLALPGNQSRWGTVIGGMSYPLYLNHWITTFLANGLMKRIWPDQFLLSTIAAAVLSVAMAMAHYWYIDRPLRAARQQWFTLRRGRWIMWTGYAMVVMGIACHFFIFAN